MGIVRDFSVESIANIREIIKVNVDEEEQWGICDWVSDWFIDDLDINDHLNSVSEYQAQMVDKYDIGSEKFDEILYRVHSVDNNYAQRYNSLHERIIEFQNKIIGISAMLSPAALSMNAEDYAELANNINNRYDNAIESYEKRISECEESLPRLDDPSLGEKILNFAGGVLTSVVLDSVEGFFFVPAVIVGVLDPRYTIEDCTDAIHSMSEKADEWIVDNLVTDEESYYYGRVTGDFITMAAGLIGMGTGLMTIIGGITVTAGGTILSLTGVGAVGGVPAIAVSVPAVAAGVLEVAGSVGVVYSGYNNMNDHIQKINEINSSPDRPDVGELNKAELADGVKETVDDINSKSKILKKTDNFTDYLNPSGEKVRIPNQKSKNIFDSIKAKLNSSNIGTRNEAKVADFINQNTNATITDFGNNVKNSSGVTIGDIDCATQNELIEVKSSISSVKVKQFEKYCNVNSIDYMNVENKSVILYIDDAIDYTNLSNVNKIEELKDMGVTVVNSLDELKGVIK